MSLDNHQSDETESEGLEGVATAVYWPPPVRPPATDGEASDAASDGVPSAVPERLTAKTMMVRCVGKRGW